MAENGELKCSLCGAPVPVNAGGDYLPHLQIPLEPGKADGERLVIRVVNPRVRCHKCKLQAVLDAVAICDANLGEPGHDILRATRSGLRELEKSP